MKLSDPWHETATDPFVSLKDLIHKQCANQRVGKKMQKVQYPRSQAGGKLPEAASTRLAWSVNHVSAEIQGGGVGVVTF